MPPTPSQLLNLVNGDPRGLGDGWPKHVVATISFRSVRRLIEDGSYLLKAADIRNNGFRLPSLCQKKFEKASIALSPFGTIFSLKSNRAQVIFCLPVSDFDMLTRLLASYGIDSTAEGEFKRFNLPLGIKIVATAKDGWAFFSNSKDSLSQLPIDPGSIFQIPSKQYTVSFSVKIHELLKTWRAIPAKENKNSLANFWEARAGEP